jgi:hypothetical protein
VEGIEELVSGLAERGVKSTWLRGSEDNILALNELVSTTGS